MMKNRIKEAMYNKIIILNNTIKIALRVSKIRTIHWFPSIITLIHISAK